MKKKLILISFVVILVISVILFKNFNKEKNLEKENIIEIGETIENDSGVWELVWSDEFNGKNLDETKWDCQIGNGSLYGIDNWGNAEEEYYTKENVSVSNGTLKIQAKKEASNGKEYTSSRIRTFKEDSMIDENKKVLFSKKYGKFEARIKLPEGEGLWPAFWLLPNPIDNTYGTWAASGELDIMEARGRLISEISGTMHYGQVWPDNKYSGGTFYFEEEDNILDFHVYSLEWEPGELRWYVDGELFHEEGSWYARGVGETKDYPFPAPFNEEFYILLNLAVGGNFDGGKSPTEENLPGIMEVDYVRVYDLVAGYDEIINKPQIVIDEKGTELYINQELDYNYVQDPNFETMNTEFIKRRIMDVTSNDWYFLALTEYSGSAFLKKGEEEGYEYVSVNVYSKGNQTYSVQLIQHMPIVKGYTYELSFDAKSEDERNILTKVGGDEDNEWTTYAGQFEDILTPNWEHYIQTFQMFSDTDGTSRLEINLGSETGELKIANIKLKVVE